MPWDKNKKKVDKGYNDVRLPPIVLNQLYPSIKAGTCSWWNGYVRGNNVDSEFICPLCNCQLEAKELNKTRSIFVSEEGGAPIDQYQPYVLRVKCTNAMFDYKEGEAFIPNHYQVDLVQSILDIDLPTPAPMAKRNRPLEKLQKEMSEKVAQANEEMESLKKKLKTQEDQFAQYDLMLKRLTSGLTGAPTVPLSALSQPIAIPLVPVKDQPQPDTTHEPDVRVGASILEVAQSKELACLGV